MTFYFMMALISTLSAMVSLLLGPADKKWAGFACFALFAVVCAIRSLRE